MKTVTDPTCRACGEKEEFIKHLLHDCDVLASKRKSTGKVISSSRRIDASNPGGILNLMTGISSQS